MQRGNSAVHSHPMLDLQQSFVGCPDAHLHHLLLQHDALLVCPFIPLRMYPYLSLVVPVRRRGRHPQRTLPRPRPRPRLRRGFPRHFPANGQNILHLRGLGYEARASVLCLPCPRSDLALDRSSYEHTRSRLVSIRYPERYLENPFFPRPSRGSRRNHSRL